MRVLIAVSALLAVLTSLAPLSADARGGGPTDSRISAGDCRLLGREFVRHHGCSRSRCQPGAHLAKAARGAEVCALRGQGAYAFGAPVESRRCVQLHRRWIAEVNWCASNPDRSRTTLSRASQCTGRWTTYVTHTEKEGAYDECLTPTEVHRLSRMAEEEDRSFEHVARDSSPVLCAYRPAHVFVDGRCLKGHDPTKAPGGVLLVGDSIAWRGSDELARSWPDLALDGMPSRRLSDLEERLAAFTLDHGSPDGLIVELGTNAARGFGLSDMTHILAALPEQTLVMLVLPYRANSHAPPTIQPASTRTAAWMRQLAAGRPATCVADWRSVVEARPRVLVDGVHPTSAAEDFWAHWTAQSWQSCRRTN